VGPERGKPQAPRNKTNAINAVRRGGIIVLIDFFTDLPVFFMAARFLRLIFR